MKSTVMLLTRSLKTHDQLGIQSSVLFIATKGMHNYIPTRHSALLTPQPSIYKTLYVPYSAATKVHNITDTPKFHTDHICHAQQYDFSMHIDMHYMPMQHYTPHCLP